MFYMFNKKLTTGKISDIPLGFLRLRQLSFGRQWHHHRSGWADAGARRHRCLEDVDPFSSQSSHRLWHQAKRRVVNISCSVMCINLKSYLCWCKAWNQYKYWISFPLTLAVRVQPTSASSPSLSSSECSSRTSPNWSSSPSLKIRQRKLVAV